MKSFFFLSFGKHSESEEGSGALNAMERWMTVVVISRGGGLDDDEDAASPRTGAGL